MENILIQLYLKLTIVIFHKKNVLKMEINKSKLQLL